MPDFAVGVPFHVEHIVAIVHGGGDGMSNLAWACARCNLKKGPNLSTTDPETNERTDLYDPRNMGWREHFEIREGVVVGTTAAGRGTARLLGMNNEHRLQHRRELIAQGEFDID